MKPSEPFGLGLFSKMTAPLLSGVDAARHLELLRTARPLVHCLTNEVVQEITANVLSPQAPRRPWWSPRRRQASSRALQEAS